MKKIKVKLSEPIPFDCAHNYAEQYNYKIIYPKPWTRWQYWQFKRKLKKLKTQKGKVEHFEH